MHTGKSGIGNDQSSQGVTWISDTTSFRVEDTGVESKIKITFSYKENPRIHEHLMLVLFSADPSMEPTEHSMKYDEGEKRFVFEIEKDRDIHGNFFISTAEIPGHPDNPKAPRLNDSYGFIALNDGIQSPVNRLPGVPEGLIKTYLYKSNGEIEEAKGSNISDLKEGERYISVYFPPSYNPERLDPYNLQITLDGGQYLHDMHMNVVLDNLIAQERIEPVVTVFISPLSGPPDFSRKSYGTVAPPGYSLDMRFREYSCNPDVADKLAEIPGTLREKIHLNVTDDPEHTTLWGVSKGGLQAEYTALLHPEVFGNVVAQSPEAWNIPSQLFEEFGEKDWRKGIRYLEDEHGIDVSWKAATAPLDDVEKEHKEYITDVMRTGFDPISGRDIDRTKLIKFYFDAGELEMKYDAKAGTANLVESTRLFAEEALEMGHEIVTYEHENHQVIIPNCGHWYLPWMGDFAEALQAMHSPKLILAQAEENDSSTGVMTDTVSQIKTPATTSQIYRRLEIDSENVFNESLKSESKTQNPEPMEKESHSGLPSIPENDEVSNDKIRDTKRNSM